jgi:integrase
MVGFTGDDLKLDEKGLVKDTDRHGNDRYYYRKKGQPKIRLREHFGSSAFREELHCARLGIPYHKAEPVVLPDVVGAQPYTLKWLMLEYLRRGCVGLGKATVEGKRYCLEAICKEEIPGGNGATYARMPMHLFATTDVEHLRDQKAETPNAGNFRKKTLSAMFEWARSAKDDRGRPLATSNPADGVKKFRIATTGFHIWTMGEIEVYRERHPPGTKAFLAFALFLMTGLRIQDVAILGRQHRYENVLPDGTVESRFRMQPKKTAVTTGVEIDIKILSPLVALLDALPKTQLVYLLTDLGLPYTVKGLGNAMRAWCDQAKLFHCSAHGLRKALASIAAENGATGPQLMAQFAWTNIRQADTYTRAASRKRLATDAVANLPIQKWDTR